MKVAVSSSSFAEPLASGELTQLEWLERCACDLAADGVIFDREHFPRTDAEYVAQLKKVAVDLGLVPVALDAGRLFEPDAAIGDIFKLATGLGVLFVLARLPAPGDVPPATFVAGVSAAKSAVREAKRENITILAVPAAGTIATNLAELRHFVKDVDSAWLRFALRAGAEPDSLGTRERALVVFVPDADVFSVAAIDEGARPWLALEGAADRAHVASLRAAAAKKTLAVANVS